MNENDDRKKHKCEFCNYSTCRKFDLKKHQLRIHKIEINNFHDTQNYEKNVSRNEKNVSRNEKNVSRNEKNVSRNEKNVNQKEKMCKKCNKIYKTEKSLIEHEKTCKGVDDLTCPRCMISFTTRQAKSKHIKNDNCKPRSIIHSRTPNPQNIENQTNNIETQINNIIDNQTNNNNFIINNYGNERLDYLSYEKMLNIFKKSYNIPSLLTKEIHFNNEFPENNNIKYVDNKGCLIKKENDYIYKNLNNLAKELIKNKGGIMQKFALENRDEICLTVDIQIYQGIIDQLISLILLNEPEEYYKEQVENIRDLIKNTNLE